MIACIKSHDISLICLKAGPYLHKNFGALHHALFSIKSKYLFVSLFSDTLYWCSYR